MRQLALSFLAVLLAGCGGPKHVSPADFKMQYELARKLQTMHEVTYLGQRDDKAFIRVRSMSTLGGKWSERIVYVKLKELDATFRETLPKAELKEKV